jgi:hypothetical protein
VTLRWRKDGRKLLFQLTTPAGYSVTVENCGSIELVRQP